MSDPRRPRIDPERAKTGPTAEDLAAMPATTPAQWAHAVEIMPVDQDIFKEAMAKQIERKFKVGLFQEVSASRPQQKKTVSTKYGRQGGAFPISQAGGFPQIEERRHMDKKQLFIERRPQGDYAIRRPNSERASEVLRTQAEAINRARELSPGKAPLVERVRYTERGKPDKWRKP